MDIDAPAWPPAGVEAADEGVIREGDPGDFYMKVIAKKFRGVWHYGVITGVVTEWVLEDYGGATQWRAVFEDGDTVDLLRSEVVEAMAAAQEHPPVDADGEARLVTVPEGDDLFAQQINRMKAHRLYREPNPNKKELESEEELPRNLLAEREDAKYTTMVARAQHFYLATPPPPPGADSDDSRRQRRRPIRAALWRPPATAPSAVADAVVAGCCEEVALDIASAGLGVCRRQSCEAMDTTSSPGQKWAASLVVSHVRAAGIEEDEKDMRKRVTRFVRERRKAHLNAKASTVPAAQLVVAEEAASSAA
eukprot:jgi/Tetstr1/423023/TSEL_001300.t1